MRLALDLTLKVHAKKDWPISAMDRKICHLV